jgi:hypothetical protein
MDAKFAQKQLERHANALNRCLLAREYLYQKTEDLVQKLLARDAHHQDVINDEKKSSVNRYQAYFDSDPLSEDTIARVVEEDFETYLNGITDFSKESLQDKLKTIHEIKTNLAKQADLATSSLEKTVMNSKITLQAIIHLADHTTTPLTGVHKQS